MLLRDISRLEIHPDATTSKPKISRQREYSVRANCPAVVPPRTAGVCVSIGDDGTALGRHARLAQTALSTPYGKITYDNVSGLNTRNMMFVRRSSLPAESGGLNVAAGR
jgi:hypothetical protein